MKQIVVKKRSANKFDEINAAIAQSPESHADIAASIQAKSKQNIHTKRQAYDT